MAQYYVHVSLVLAFKLFLTQSVEGSWTSFEGLSRTFIEVVSGSEERPQSRYAELLDYVQYHNPPYVQVDMEKELGIPQPSISRFFSVMRERARARVRLDFVHRLIGLRVVAVAYESSWLRSVPALDWVSSISHTNSGTLIFYRVPEENVEDLREVLKEKAGEPSSFRVLDDVVLSKPSIKHYIAERESQNPLAALKENENHPQVDPRLLLPYQSETMNLARDYVDLYLLMRGEMDAVSALIETWSTLATLNVGRAKRKVLYHLSHIAGAMRGSKVMLYDSSPNSTLVYASVEGDRRCSKDVIKYFSTYLYTVAHMREKEGLPIVLFSLPPKYMVRVLSFVKEMCGATKISSHVLPHGGTFFRQMLPIRNYDVNLKRWDFWNAPLLEALKKDFPKYQVSDEYFVEVPSEAYLEMLWEEMRREEGEEKRENLRDIS
ncbi:MAG: hypothetical protein ABDH61_06085 [Acidilobaceae archaeon]